MWAVSFSSPLSSAVRYVSRHYTVIPGWKEADEGRTSVATSPNVSPPIIRSSKPEVSQDESEASSPVMEEKEKVPDTKEGVSAPSPTSTAGESAAPEETKDVSDISLPYSRADENRRRNPLHLPLHHHPDPQEHLWKQQPTQQ